LKSGKSHYQQPVLSSNPSSQKLVPSDLPRQTKHDRKKKNIEALGRNNNMMANYLIRVTPAVENINPMIDPNLEHATLEPVVDQSSNPKSTDSNTVELRLTELQKGYLSAKKSPVTKDKSEKAKARWDELNTAINTVTVLLKEKSKKDKRFKFPQLIMNDLKEFNSLRLKFTIAGTPLPSEAAALATAQSSIRQNSAKNQPQNERSGIYLARNIARQARHVVSHRELLLIKNGNRKNHKSLLDNIKLRESLFKWASLQVPGAVRISNFVFIIIFTF
jgi:hypothetical protein